MPHAVNWYAGWALILAAFIGGAGLGLFFHRDDFLGGYASWPRRLLRLGHIACAALGILNVAYGLSPIPPGHGGRPQIIAAGLIVGGITMPLVCFLSAWKKSFKRLFFIPVAALMAAVALILST
jgi:hypothetical protein